MTECRHEDEQHQLHLWLHQRRRRIRLRRASCASSEVPDNAVHAYCPTSDSPMTITVAVNHQQVYPISSSTLLTTDRGQLLSSRPLKI